MNLRAQSSWVVLAVVLVSGFFAVSGYAQNPSAASEMPVLTVLNINKSTVEQLQTINGIGHVIADRVIKYREENGKFEVLEDLMDVHGIGQVKFERIKKQLVL